MAKSLPSQCCETCHGQGCRIDHGATRYAKAMNQRTGKVQLIKVREDTGTDVNWVSPQLVRDCNFPVFEVKDKNQFWGFNGEQFCPRQRVKISFTGKLEKTEQTEFFVAPMSFPVEGLLVGNGFINSIGHSHNVFLEEPDKTLIMVQKKPTVGKGSMKIPTGRGRC